MSTPIYTHISNHEYDLSKLREEVLSLCDAYYPQPGNRKGEWLGVPLRNPKGTTDAEGIYILRSFKGRRGGGMKKCLDSDFMKEVPYIRSILDEFERCGMTVYLARLLKLLPHGSIKCHSDGPNFEYKDGPIARFHIPIVTDRDIIMNWPNDEVSLHLEEGQLYYVNVAKKHSIDNPTDVTRIHLVFDVDNNEKTKVFIENNNKI